MNQANRIRRSTCRITVIAAVFAAIAQHQNRAQEALRSSMMTQQFDRQRANRSLNGGYNLKLGPVEFSTSAGASFEYNDNINVVSVAPQSDFTLQPRADLNAIWVISEANSLNIDVSVGYIKYIDHPENDRVVVSPLSASDISYDLHVSIFRFNIHDRFSYTVDPLQNGTVVGTATFGRFQNLAGVMMTWPLKDWTFGVGYDHANYLYSGGFQQLDSSAEYLFFRTGYAVRPDVTIGLEGTSGFTTYDSKARPNNQNYTFGPYATWHVSDYIDVSAAGGYSTYRIDGPSGTGDTSAPSSVYASLSLRHVINRFVSQSINVARETTQGIGDGNFLQSTSIRHTAQWNIIRNVSLGTELFYEMSEESGGPLREKFERFGASPSLSYRLTEKLTTGLTYRYTKKWSSLALRDYAQNSVGLTLSYKF